MQADSVPETVPVRKARGRPPKITREEVVAASVDLADLTLKSVADHLGVTTQALYRYIRDREELIGMVAERMAERFPLPPDRGEDWCVWAYDFAHVLHDLYSAVPGLAEHAMNAPPTSPNVLKQYDVSIQIARRSGFDTGAALWATQAVIDFVHAVVAREQRREASAKDGEGSPAEKIQETLLAHAAEVPNLAESVAAVIPGRIGERFDYMLRALLLGLGESRSISQA